jgi:exosome complex component MTR3
VICILNLFERLCITNIYFVTDVKTGVVSQAKGSAYIEQNNTKVVCSVFDPREIPRKSGYSVNGELYCEFKFAPFSCIKWRSHQPDAFEKECSLILRRSLEPAVCRVSCILLKV